jgi:hypothetical protein
MNRRLTPDSGGQGATVLDIFDPSENPVSNRDTLAVEMPRMLNLKQRAVSS